MTSNVNVFMTNWQWTGQSVPTPQATVDMALNWKDSDGQSHDWSGVVTFPNDLQDLPVAWVRQALEELMLRAVRVKLDIDEIESVG